MPSLDKANWFRPEATLCNSGSSGSSASVAEIVASRHASHDSRPLSEREPHRPCQRQENRDGIVMSILSECAYSGGKEPTDIPVVEFVLPPPDYDIGLPHDFEFSLSEAAQQSSSRSRRENHSISFVELGRNATTFAELAARKRDEAIGACIDSALDLLFRDREATASTEKCDLTEATASEVGAWADTLLRSEERDTFAAASNASIWLSRSQHSTPIQASRCSPPASPFAASRALAAALVAGALPAGSSSGAVPSSRRQSRGCTSSATRCRSPPIWQPSQAVESPCSHPAVSPLAVIECREGNAAGGKPPPSPPPSPPHYSPRAPEDKAFPSSTIESTSGANEPLPEPWPEPPTTASPGEEEIFKEEAPSRELTLLDPVNEEYVCCDEHVCMDVVMDKVRASCRPGRSMFPHSFLAYVPGDNVEYFSSTHQRWINGTMSIQIDDATSLINYSVHIGVSGQLRDDICLETVRTPLREGEPIELLDLRCGAWVPARIFGKQAAYPTQLGYRVQLEDGSDKIIEMAPTERLRRRFSARAQVEVYKGPKAGWCAVTVHPDADHLQASPSALSGLPPYSSKLTLPASANMSKELPHPAVMTEAQNYLETQLWTPVPLSPLCQEAGMGAISSWVPSYLLRFPKMGNQGIPVTPQRPVVL